MQALQHPSHPWLNRESMDVVTDLPRPMSCKLSFLDALGTASDSEYAQLCFQRYPLVEILRGQEMVKNVELLNFIKVCRDDDLRLLLKFKEDDSLGWFETLKDLRASDIVNLRETIAGASHRLATRQVSTLRKSRNSRSLRLSNASGDSGYASRPGSEIDSTIGMASDDQRYSSATSQIILAEEPPASASFNSAFPSPTPFHENRFSNAPQSPQGASSGSVTFNPSATAKLSKLRPFECIYCPQSFVRLGDCLNHEEHNHSQRKEWICPHCHIQSKTKVGHDRHHRTHGCQQCPDSDRVVVLSGPKTACACPCCSILFQGDASFEARANHVRTTHSKGDRRKMRTSIDHSRMIQSLLSRDGFAEVWNLFLERKPALSLSWTPDNAREIVGDLEFGEYPNGIYSLIQRVYDLADKEGLLPNIISASVNQGDQRNPRGAPLNASNNTPVQPMGPARNDSDTPMDAMELTMDDEHAMAPVQSSSTRHATTAQRTRQLLASCSSDGVRDSSHSGGSMTSSSGRAHHRQGSQPSHPGLRENVFMGCGRVDTESPVPMELTPQPAVQRNTRGPRIPSPPSHFWEMDESLMRMEDLMTQQIMASSGSSRPAPTYTPPGWVDSLPPSLQTAAGKTPPPRAPLPCPPGGRGPRGAWS